MKLEKCPRCGDAVTAGSPAAGTAALASLRLTPSSTAGSCVADFSADGFGGRVDLGALSVGEEWFRCFACVNREAATKVASLADTAVSL